MSEKMTLLSKGIDWIYKSRHKLAFNHPYVYLALWPFVALIIRMPITFMWCIVEGIIYAIADYYDLWKENISGWIKTAFGNKEKSVFWRIVQKKKEATCQK